MCTANLYIAMQKIQSYLITATHVSPGVPFSVPHMVSWYRCVNSLSFMLIFFRKAMRFPDPCLVTTYRASDCHKYTSYAAVPAASHSLMRAMRVLHIRLHARSQGEMSTMCVMKCVGRLFIGMHKFGCWLS